MKKEKKIKNNCVFCGRKTNYNYPGIGYICPKCLGEYEGARLRELGKSNRKIEPSPNTTWTPQIDWIPWIDTESRSSYS